MTRIIICECGHKERITHECIEKDEVINHPSCHKCHDRKVVEAGLKMFEKSAAAKPTGKRIVMGLPVTVYYNPQFRGCANGGISERFDRLILVGENLRGFEEVDLDNPAENVVYLAKRHLFGRDIYHVEPMDGVHATKWTGKKEKRWYASGGSYASTCDSRLGEATDGFYGALAIHDRTE